MERSKRTTVRSYDLLPVEPFRQKLAAELACTIMQHWQLSDDEQLLLTGLRDLTTLRMWQHKAFTELGPDNYLRLVALIEVNRLLRSSGKPNNFAAKWIRTRNRFFDNQSPLDYMLSNGKKGIHDVCAVLEHVKADYIDLVTVH